jgi:CRP-like cAMP-binding protein
MDLDFTQPSSRDDAFDPAIARQCFQSLGKAQDFAAGKTLFAEGDASDRMYLLVAGEVSLIHNRRTLDIAKVGEVFGEIAVITQHPRSASAVARSGCRVLTLDAQQFQQAIQATPQFALMLMNIMNNRLRLTLALMNQIASVPGIAEHDASPVFDKKLTDELIAALRSPPLQTFPANRIIMKEGDSGVSMYLVMRGKVAVSVKSVVVERIGPGGVLGEMALVDQSARAATAVAETECHLLAIRRTDFLDLVKTKPGFAVSLLKAMADRLARMTAQKK